MIAAGAEEIAHYDRVAVLQRFIQHRARPKALAGRLRVNRRRRAVHRLDGGEEMRAVRELAVADFARPVIGILAALPLAGAAAHEPHAFLRGDEQLVLGIVVPVDRLKVVARVREVGNERELPGVVGIGGLRVTIHLAAFAFVVLVAATVQRLDDQLPLAARREHPVHAMHRRLVMQPHRLPLLRAILRRNEIKDRAALVCVAGLAGIPARADRDLAFAIAINVLRRDAHVVLRREVLGDDVLLPIGIVIPLNRLLIGKDDVRLPIAVHVRDRDAVADAHRRINFLDAKLRLRWLGSERRESEITGTQQNSGRRELHDVTTLSRGGRTVNLPARQRSSRLSH